MRTFYLIFFLLISNGTIAQTKVGVVNSQKVLDALPYRDSMIKVLEKIEQEGLEELGRMDSVLFTLYPRGDYSWTNELKEAFNSKIKNQQHRIQIREKEIDSTLMAIGNDLNVRSIKIVKTAVEIVASSMGIDLIVDESVMLYYEDKIDITQQVINELVKPAK